MFTGIITDIGEVKAVEKHKASRDFTIATRLNMGKTDMGASICCSGVCLTVTKKGKGWFKANASQETLDRTNLAGWKKGTKINLEKSLKMGDELGGHIVFGHVDFLAELKGKKQIGDSYRLSVAIPAQYKKFVVEKGSVTLEGVSLTINAVKDKVIEVNLVPHTWQNTCFKNAKAGDKFNLEIDMLARYVAKQFEKK